MVSNLPKFYFSKLRSRWKPTPPVRTSSALVLDRLYVPGPPASFESLIIAAHPTSVLASQSLASLPQSSVNPVAPSISKILWEQAIDSLNDEDRKGLNFTGGANIDIFHELMNAITEKQKDCHEKRWSYQNSSGRRVYVRDSVESFIEQLNKYASIGDLIIQHHPGIVALAWAGFRFLLQVATSDTENMKIVMESINSLVRVLSRCDIYEKLYCAPGHNSTQPLDGSMVDLYGSVLQYLCSARRYLEKPTAGRVLGSILTDLKPLLEKIQRLEEVVTRDASIAHQQALATPLFDNDLKMGQLLALLEAMNEPTRRMEGIIMAIYTSIEGAKRGKVLAWISDATFSDHHNLVSSARNPDTGGWLFLKDTFRHWEDSDSSSLFWLCGGAGSGKTMLASKMIDRMEPESTQYGRAYFYCNYKEDHRRDPASILRSLVKQLCQGSPDGSFSERALSIYMKRKEDGNMKSLLSIVEAQDLLIELSAGFKSTTILIDALDECHEETRAQLLDVLEHILSLTELNPIKIFVTGRNDGDLRTRLEKFGNIFIQERDNASDIELYIVSAVETCISNGRLLHGKVGDNLKQHTIDVLQSGAHGMFIWVQHQIRSICEEATEADVRAALTKLPKGLDDSYKVVLRKIDGQSCTTAAHARSILMWILYARRPLTSEELLEALTVQPRRAEFKQGGLTLAKALEICQNLVVLDVALGVLRFTHFSVDEFLLKYYHSADAHSTVAIACLTLLTHHYPGPFRDPRKSRLMSEYSTWNWIEHVILSGTPTNELVQYCHEFFAHSDAFTPWYSLNRRRGHRKNGPTASISATMVRDKPVLLATILGLQNLLNHFLNAGADLNITTACIAPVPYLVPTRGDFPGIRYSFHLGLTALHLAAMNSDLEMIQYLLLQDRIDVDKRNEEGQTALLKAAQFSEADIVACFLQHSGVDVNSRDNGGRTALSWALTSPVHSGKRPHGFDIRLGGTSCPTTIQRLLKDERVIVDQRDHSGRTPLSWTASHGDSHGVRYLLNSGSDINSTDDHGRTPLSWAVSSRNRETIEQLLRWASKIALCDIDGRASSQAATNDQVDTMREALEYRPSTNIPDSGGQAPPPGENTTLVQIRSYGDIPDNDGLTPLSRAVLIGDLDIVCRLLAVTPHVDTPDRTGHTPLLYAARLEYREMVELLLQNNPDVNKKDMDGRTALSWAASSGSIEIVTMLLETGRIEFNWADKSGCTPIGWAAKGRHLRVAELLRYALLKKDWDD